MGMVENPTNALAWKLQFGDRVRGTVWDTEDGGDEESGVNISTIHSREKIHEGISDADNPAPRGMAGADKEAVPGDTHVRDSLTLVKWNKGEQKL